MSHPTTVKVSPWSDDQGDFVIINAEDFNAEVHTLFEGEVAPAAPAPAAPAPAAPAPAAPAPAAPAAKKVAAKQASSKKGSRQ